ncbi:hypothetical protein LOZ51_004929 [Ophidiomyces ophidiicola]|nr:hypothetical protein LOZ54_002896 [Ophidiomyces ophidiicola]KAI1990578.1 hypothetical protein LOZ51_004929 [Ophidiomyces ophidiicola]
MARVRKKRKPPATMEAAAAHQGLLARSPLVFRFVILLASAQYVFLVAAAHTDIAAIIPPKQPARQSGLKLASTFQLRL